MGKIEHYSGIIGQNVITQSRAHYACTSSIAANSTSTVSEEAAINELMDDNNDGEYVQMSKKLDQNFLPHYYVKTYRPARMC